jgi:HAD superfamily hydrolase (TIGR01484 family)
MPTIKLICTDIDGTMLRPDHSIGPRTKAAIQAAHKKGIVVALISGRIRSSLVNIQNELGISGPLGTLNGSLALDEKGKPILEHPLQSDEIHHILEWVKHTDLNTFVYTNDNWYASEEGYWTDHELTISGIKGQILSFDEIEGRLGDRSYSITDRADARPPR